MNTTETLLHAFAIVEEGVETQDGPRYSTCAQQVDMARLLLIRDNAIDGITGALHLYGPARALREIQETLDRMHAAEAENSQSQPDK